MNELTLRFRAHTLVLLAVSFAAVVLLTLVAAIVAYSTHMIDELAAGNEARLVDKRVELALGRLRENLISGTVWNDAYVNILAGDQAWMNLNVGEYYSSTMGHDLTVVQGSSGDVIYAAQDGQQVAPGSKAAFVAAVAPLVGRVKREAARQRAPGSLKRPLGFSAVVTREGIVSVSGQAYLVSVSTVVPEEAVYDQMERSDPIVVSGYQARKLVDVLSNELGLLEPRLVESGTVTGPHKVLRDIRGQAIAVIGWTSQAQGKAQLLSSAPLLGGILLLLLIAMAFGGLRVSRLIKEFARNQRELEKAVDTAEAAYAAKSQFLANMSHELRTPLNGIVAMSMMLQPRQTDDQSREMTRTIVASARMLEHVVNDILDASKIETGQMGVEWAPFELDALLVDVMRLHSASAAAKGVNLTLTISESAAGAYLGDGNRLAQIASNLLSNAVKFTEAGEIRMTARLSRQRLCLCVSDTGPGFDRAVSRLIFEKFVQADVSVSRQHGGSGLGLSISKSLARLMGGDIRVRSTPGKGSIFLVDLPLPRVVQPREKATPAPAPTQAYGTMNQVSVLLVDDHEVNLRVASLILEPFDMDITIARNGKEALELATVRKFDLILMDVQMPEMDGLTATRAIREHERHTGAVRTPIISLTANAMPDDVKRSLDAGSDMHIAKPFRPQTLIEAIQSLRDRTDLPEVVAA